MIFKRVVYVVSLLVTTLILFLSGLQLTKVGTDKVLPNNNVYVSVTTSPKRIKFLPDILDNLDLSLVKKVIISIPEHYGPTGETYNIPEKLLADNKVVI